MIGSGADVHDHVLRLVDGGEVGDGPVLKAVIRVLEDVVEEGADAIAETQGCHLCAL